MAENVEDELQRRYRSAVGAVTAMFALTALLVVLAFTGVRPHLPNGMYSSTLYGLLWLMILFLGLGAVAVRRARFAAMRLDAIAALRGPLGLLVTLQRTTIIVALIGGAIAVLGYLLTLLTNDTDSMRNAAIIAIAVLFYCYPRRAAWRRVIAATQQPGGLTAEPPAKGTPA
ncbi:MAG: hypothetical protein DMF64_21620 [Acidobacteria bacterium]|nr:MAG: hypothetical protein DMF64_21620 [Acidobacteriota bacterium]